MEKVNTEGFETYHITTFILLFYSVEVVILYLIEYCVFKFIQFIFSSFNLDVSIAYFLIPALLISELGLSTKLLLSNFKDLIQISIRVTAKLSIFILIDLIVKSIK